MKLVPHPEGYAILHGDNMSILCWVTNQEMDRLMENIVAGIPQYYSNDGRYYPVSDQEIDKSAINKAVIFKMTEEKC